MLFAVLKIHYFLIQYYCPPNATFQTHFVPFSVRKAILKGKIAKVSLVHMHTGSACAMLFLGSALRCD